jgi:signal transduction histidine kinase/ligand-binding sensor domain-containing protein/DNA-binding response OmpR family regulator
VANYRIYLFLYLFIFIIPFKIKGQDFRVNSLKINEDLPSLTVNRTYQDSNGFIWFATQAGLCRYDGNQLLHINPETAIGDAEISNNIRAIHEVGHSLLIGTEKGLCAMDKATCRIKKIDAPQLRGQYINVILIDKQHRIWLGTRNGIYVLDKNFNVQRHYHAQSASSALAGNTVNFIYQDRNGTIWACLWEKGLARLDANTNRFISLSPIGIRNNPFKILQDKNNRYWICTWGDGLYAFNPPANATHTASYQKIPFKNDAGYSEKIVYNILQDDFNGDIWTLSFSGISCFRTMKNGQIAEINVKPFFDQTANIFSDIFLDRKGSIWLGVFDEGMSTIDFKASGIHNYHLPYIKQHYHIAPKITMLNRSDRQDVLWFNQDRVGLGSLNLSTQQIIMYSEKSDLGENFAIKDASSVIDFGDELWLAGAYDAKISVFSKNGSLLTNKGTIQLADYDAKIGTPSQLFRDNKGIIWVLTSNGILKKSSPTSDFESVKEISGAVTGAAESHDELIWFCTKDRGIFAYDRKTSKIAAVLNLATALLKSSKIQAIATDKHDFLWIATQDGRLFRYNPKTKIFQQFLPNYFSQQLQVLNLYWFDNFLWITTARSIFRFDPEKQAVEEYSAKDGIAVKLFSPLAITPTNDDHTLFFAGNNGIVGISTKEPRQDKKLNVFITDLKINNRSIFEFSDPSKFNFNALNLKLNPSEEQIEINFSALQYRSPEKIRFAYKLEGIDKNWVQVSGDRPFATYHNLPKGNYTFMVKVLDSSNNSASGITRLSIRKTAAFYESNMAYALYLILILFIVHVVSRFIYSKIKLKQELEIAQIEKDKSDELTNSKIDYFTNISHELLTPLTILSCLVDDIEHATKNKLTQLDRMRSNLDRLRRLLEQVLDFRKTENRNMVLKVASGNVTAFVDQLCINYFSPLAEKNKITFHIRHREHIDTAYFDADKLDKILFNLLSNAFKYTDVGGTIEVLTQLQKKNGQTLLFIDVQDNGTGIPAEELHKIFVQFYTNKTTRKTGSNGIGLALARELARLHHGTLTVRSELGKGSCFTLIIPLDPESYTPGERVHSDIPVVQHSGSTVIHEAFENTDKPIPNKNALSLLIVEDNDDLRMAIKNILSRSYNVFVASNGLEALELLAEQDVDIIISDVMMPKMDGWELCRRLKKDIEKNHIPIILLTAKIGLEDRVDSYNAGADGYISKPFELRLLEARINSFVINKRTRQQAFKAEPKIDIAKLEYPTVDEQFLEKTIRAIEEHMSDSTLEVGPLAEILGLSKSTLNRKIKNLLDLSTSKLIKNVRLKHAYQMLEKDKSITISEVSYTVGFSDSRYFATSFKQQFGITPTDLQKGTKTS